jgi:outer membrane protein OmpA-like peptidoglycan-associated protein
MKKLFGKTSILLALTIMGCSSAPAPGPDKQGQGMVMGALVGAGTGAVTGAQVTSATGPGAAVGAGFGAIAGGIRGLAQDQIEADLMQLAQESQNEIDIARAHQVILDHYKTRVELYPSRDIYPADLFFEGDSHDVRAESEFLVQEIARLNLYRFPWSRLVITSYVKSNDLESTYANELARRRADSISNLFVQVGMNPRRIEGRAVVIPAPLVIDPFDSKDRYSQAIEFTPIDR